MFLEDTSPRSAVGCRGDGATAAIADYNARIGELTPCGAPKSAMLEPASG